MIPTPSTPVGSSRYTWRELREKLEREDYERSYRSAPPPDHLHPLLRDGRREAGAADVPGTRLRRDDHEE